MSESRGSIFRSPFLSSSYPPPLPSAHLRRSASTIPPVSSAPHHPTHALFSWSRITHDQAATVTLQKMMNHGNQLPLEVILLVLDRFKESEQFSATRRRETGRSAALVCRSLREVGTSMVWSDVKQSLGKQERELKTILENERIAAKVRHLSLVAESTFHRTNFVESDFAQLLPRLCNLQHLELVNLPAGVLDQFFTSSPSSLPCDEFCLGLYCPNGHRIPPDQLRNPFGPTLRSLTIKQKTAEWSRPQELLSLLSRIPTLRQVNLELNLCLVDPSRGRTQGQEMEDVQAISNLEVDPIPIDSLTVILTGGSSRLNTAVLAVLLNKVVIKDKLHSLRIKHLAGAPEENWIPIFPSLSTFLLELPSVSFSNHLPVLARNIPQSHQLRSLFLRVLNYASQLGRTTTAPPRVLKRFLDSLPPHLEEIDLAITFPGGPHGEPLNSFLQDRRQMALQQISFTERTQEAQREFRGVSWVRKQQDDDGSISWQVSREGSIEYTYI
ncbi:hypothetical protein JCM3765_003465 [Sporobolomyces pararoseus]